MARQKPSDQPTTETKATKSAEAIAPNAGMERQYRGSMVLDHDLFKLLPAELIRNVSYTDKPRYVPLEHCHIFHTIDSSGRAQTQSNEVGNHFHMVTVMKNQDGTIKLGPDGKPEIEVSPPMRLTKTKNQDGTVVIQASRIPYDSHVHEVEYLGSDKITVRKVNTEFMKFESQVRQKFNPVAEGVSEGGA